MLLFEGKNIQISVSIQRERDLVGYLLVKPSKRISLGSQIWGTFFDFSVYRLISISLWSEWDFTKASRKDVYPEWPTRGGGDQRVYVF